MFLGHVAVALAAKRAAPRASLGVLLGAAVFIDLLWPVFLLLGWETVRVAPGITAFTPLDFTSYPISHSLVAVLWWSLFAGIAYFAATRYRNESVTVGVLVLSHWILDFVTHRPDLPILPSDGPKVGLGLWHSVPATLAVELLLFGACLAVYLGTTRARDGVGRWGFWALIAFLAAVYLANAFGPPPPDARSLAWVAMAAWIFPLWAWWADRHREPTPQVPETAFGARPEARG